MQSGWQHQSPGSMAASSVRGLGRPAPLRRLRSNLARRRNFIFRTQVCYRRGWEIAISINEVRAMAQEFTICVGTVGEGVWFSPDSGEHWRRGRMKVPFHAQPGEIQIRSLAVSPHNSHHLLAGSEAGIYRSEDNGASWDLIDSPLDGMQIWSVAWHLGDADVIFAGTKPPAVYRRQNGRWE